MQTSVHICAHVWFLACHSAESQMDACVQNCRKGVFPLFWRCHSTGAGPEEPAFSTQIPYAVTSAPRPAVNAGPAMRTLLKQHCIHRRDRGANP